MNQVGFAWLRKFTRKQPTQTINGSRNHKIKSGAQKRSRDDLLTRSQLLELHSVCDPCVRARVREPLHLLRRTSSKIMISFRAESKLSIKKKAKIGR